MKGWIYRIFHSDSETGGDDFQGSCYVGQTRIQGGVRARFNQHKNACKRVEFSKKKADKAAKLHDFMRLKGLSNFKIDELQCIECNDAYSLQEELNRAELHWQKHFNSVKNGWNKVNAPQPAPKKGASLRKSIASLSSEYNVAYTSLLYRINSLEESPEQAVSHLQKVKEQPVTIYRYARQEFSSYNEVSMSMHNKHKVDKKTIESRTRSLMKKGQIEVIEENGKLYVDLKDSVFDKIVEIYYQINLEDGIQLEGAISEIRKQLLRMDEYKEVVPSYSTIVARLAKESQGKLAWSVVQAFGLDYPPNLAFVKELVEEKGYKFIPENPSFKRLANCKPIVLDAAKEIFASQRDFCDTYKIPPDRLSDLLAKGYCLEQIFRHLGIHF